MSGIPHYLVVGLGNITHPMTRHSVGHLIIDSLAARFGVRMDFDRSSLCWEGTKELDLNPYGTNKSKGSHLSPPMRAKFTFIKPKPLMNISGSAVAQSLRKHIRPASPSQLIVVHDSLSHRPLHVSPKAGGSAEGHNGVRSVIQALGGDAKFRRIRVGIGKGSGDVAAYVLGRLSPEERGFWAVEGLDLVWREIEAMATKP
ncbi:peptidyl-tRNA hydrolase [Ramaria rubella]|nr:peptidyl-tRNA hydrolase [Ramaria rubella]